MPQQKGIFLSFSTVFPIITHLKNIKKVHCYAVHRLKKESDFFIFNGIGHKNVNLAPSCCTYAVHGKRIHISEARNKIKNYKEVKLTG